MSAPVIYIVRSWPRLSQTFILNEILALERRGVELGIFSLARSGEHVVQSGVAQVRSSISYLEDALRQPLRRRLLAHLRLFLGVPMVYARSLILCLCRPGLAAGYGECSAWRCFSLAVHVVTAIEQMRAHGHGPRHLHAHFAHDPALVGMLAARLARLTFSFTAHARDLVQIPPAALAARAAQAQAIVTCCVANAEYIRSAVAATVLPPVRVIHHGVDLSRFVPPPDRPAGTVPTLTSVGRLVEKKGYVDLLHALALVKSAGGDFRCSIVGSGPLRQTLHQLRDELELRDRVQLVDSLDQDQVIDRLRATDIFILTPRVAADGDRDGIPNVLVEAMAMGLPVVTTNAGGVTELVQHGVNGLVANVGDPGAVADLVGALLAEPVRRRRLGAAAKLTVERDFDVDVAARELELVLRPRDRTLVVDR